MDLTHDVAPYIPLRLTGRLERLSTDAEPTVDEDGGTLQIGTERVIRETGARTYWNGSAWKPVTLIQKLNQLIDLLIESREG